MVDGFFFTRCTERAIAGSQNLLHPNGVGETDEIMHYDRDGFVLAFDLL